MERLLLSQFYTWLFALPMAEVKRVQFCDRWIVLTFLWAVLCDRPLSWACLGENWPPGFLCAPPPSPSTMSRRMKSLSVQTLLRELVARDPDAKVGRGAGMLAKGYKLHALWACTGSLEAWRVEPLNVAEIKMAATMVPVLKGPGYLVGDHLFDWKVLYHEAGERGVQLVVTPEKGASPMPRQRRQDPHRVIGLKLAHTSKGKAMLHRRFGIDRLFGQLGNQGGGLGPLPNWVRRLPRVRNWVAGKLIWFSFRRRLKNKDLR
jgi:hypothetical protein